MPPVIRSCSECGGPLQSRAVTSKTCSDKCRSERSRRLRREERAAAELAERPSGVQAIAALVNRGAQDAVGTVMRDELRPIVREALTEDVLRSVSSMLGLTARAVELIAEDLESEDATVRQRAYTLVTKYTIGHPALLQPKDSEAGQQLVVNFNLPRPAAEALEVLDGELEPEDLPRVCDTCHVEKPAGEFQDGSERCLACFEQRKAEILAAYA